MNIFLKLLDRKRPCIRLEHYGIQGKIVEKFDIDNKFPIILSSRKVNVADSPMPDLREVSIVNGTTVRTLENVTSNVTVWIRGKKALSL